MEGSGFTISFRLKKAMIHIRITKTKETLSFDLIGKGVEWIIGGQRINNYDQLVTNIKKKNRANLEDFETLPAGI